MICPRRSYALVAAIWLAAPLAAPQQDDARARIRTTVELVVVPVTVKDAKGNLVLDLREDDFRIFDDDVEQPISLFSAEPFPLSVVVLVDNALPGKASEQVRKSLPAIAAGIGEADEVALGRFDTQFDQFSDFSTDNDHLFDQLKRLELGGVLPGIGSGPMTAGPRINAAPAPGAPARAPMRTTRSGSKNIDDAIFTAGQLLRGRERGRRKIIYLVSDGQNSRQNAVRFDEVIKLLLSSDIAVYAIGVGDPVLNPGKSVLSQYASATGGDVFYAKRRADLESLYAELAVEARNQYTLAYVPQKAPRDADCHSIEVRVRRPGLTLLARDAYCVPAAP